MDPLFKSLTIAFAEGLSSGLLLSALSCYTDSSELVLDSTTVIDDIESQPVSKTNKDPVGMSDIKGKSVFCLFLLFFLPYLQRAIANIVIQVAYLLLCYW